MAALSGQQQHIIESECNRYVAVFMTHKKPSFDIEINLLKLSGKSSFYNSDIKKIIHPRLLAIFWGG
jgi:hypothetical protein